MGRNDYRDRMRQRNIILDPGLDRLLVAGARAAGVSVNRFVVGLIEQEVARAGDGAGRGSDSGVAAAGNVAGAPGGRGGDGDLERVPVQGRSVDWEGLLEAGRAAKLVGAVDVPMFDEPDPLDVIA
jgi:hypothetical protein